MSRPIEGCWLAPQLVHHVWVARQGDTNRVAGDLAVIRLRRSCGSISVGCSAVIALVALLLGVYEWALIILAAAIFTVAIVIAVGLHAYLGVAPRTYPDARWASGFGEYQLMVTTPVAAVVVDYRALSRVDAFRGVVVISFRANGTEPLMLPANLCPPAALNYLHKRIRDEAQ